MFMIQSQHTKSMSQPQHKHIYYRSISLLFWCFTLAKYIFSHFFFKFKYKIFENGINLKSQWIAIARKRDKNLFEIIVKIFGYCGKHETVKQPRKIRANDQIELFSMATTTTTKRIFVRCHLTISNCNKCGTFIKLPTNLFIQRPFIVYELKIEEKTRTKSKTKCYK